MSRRTRRRGTGEEFARKMPARDVKSQQNYGRLRVLLFSVRPGTPESGEIYLPGTAGLRCRLKAAERFSDISKRRDDQLQLLEPSMI